MNLRLQKRLLLLLLPAIGALCPASPFAGDARPNVILIITDDQGYGDFSAHGNPVLKTPNMDRLHGESVRFTDFHVAPMCSPTRGQLMTGIDAMKNGCTAVCEGRSMMRAELPTMADFFAGSGYATGHFGKWHLGDSYPHRPQDRGFQETIHHRAWGITSLADHWENHVDPYYDPILSHNGVDKKFPGYCTDIFFDESMKWIEKQSAAEKPFFVYLPTNTPHVPNICPDKYAAPYRGEYEGKKMPAEFYGMIANLDENLGRLEAFLREKGLRENTLVIYLADNGTQSTQAKEIYNAGMRDKKTSVYEGGHRVPLFVRWPKGKLQHGKEIVELTQVQDLLPTLIELCGLELIDSPLEFDGTSLTGLLKGEDEELPDRKLVVQYRSGGQSWEPAVVLWDQWRLVRGKELFHIGEDPGQTTNVAEKNPAIVKVMSDHYDAWYAEAKPLFDKERWITLREPGQILYSQDWVGDYCDNPGGLYRGMAVGYWNVIVENSALYEIELRRWPFEADLPLAGGGKENRGARPIVAANLQINGQNYTVDLGEGATHATFNAALPAGKLRLATHFLDDQDQILCSAIYVKVSQAGDHVKVSPESDRQPKGRAPNAPSRRNSKGGRKVSAPIKLGLGDRLLSDFEADDFGDWKAEGDAFKSGPTGTKGRIAGHQGERLADTFLANGSDAPTGTLLSPAFEVEKRYLHFLVGGGRHPGKTGVALLVDDRRVKEATGNSTKNAEGRKVLEWVSWDLSRWKGREARIEIYDEQSGGWGHIAVDQLFLSDRPLPIARKENPASKP